MPPLNEDLTWDNLESVLEKRGWKLEEVEKARKAFRSPPGKILVNCYDLLFRYDNASIGSSDSSKISAWWGFAIGRSSADGGFAPIRAAEARGESGSRHARARLAVDRQWSNPMDLLVIAHLKVAAWGFYGVAKHQRYDSRNEDLKNALWIGGAWQIWIPSLEPDKVNFIKREVVEGSMDEDFRAAGRMT